MQSPTCSGAGVCTTPNNNDYSPTVDCGDSYVLGGDSGSRYECQCDSDGCNQSSVLVSTPEPTTKPTPVSTKHVAQTLRSAVHA